MIRFKGKFRTDDFGPKNSPFTPFREKYSHKNQNSNFKLLFNACHQVPFHENLINRFYVKFKITYFKLCSPLKKKKKEKRKRKKKRKQCYRWMDRQTSWQAGRNANRQMNQQTNTWTNAEFNGLSDRSRGTKYLLP